MTVKYAGDVFKLFKHELIGVLIQFFGYFNCDGVCVFECRDVSFCIFFYAIFFLLFCMVNCKYNNSIIFLLLRVINNEIFIFVMVKMTMCRKEKKKKKHYKQP